MSKTYYEHLEKLRNAVSQQGFSVVDLIIFESMEDLINEYALTQEEVDWYYNAAHNLAAFAYLKDEAGLNVDDICREALNVVILGEEVNPRELLLRL